MMTSSGVTRGGQTRAPWLALALALGTFLLYAPVLRYDFVDYDDWLYVYKNRVVLGGLSLEGFKYAFTTVDGGSWMPLTWLSLMLDVSLFGAQPGGLHFTNNLLHALTAGFLTMALSRLTGRVWLSVIAAAIFALHPLRTESVAWIAERKDVLSGLCFALGLLAYAHYVKAPKPARFALVILSLLLGLMAKPMLVTFPFVLLLLDLWPLGRFGNNWSGARARLWPLVREKAALFVMIVGASAFTYWSQRQTGALSRWSGNRMEQLADIAGNYGFYLLKFVVPVDRTVIYPDQQWSPLLLALLGLALAGVTVFVVRQAFSWPGLAVGWLWFLGMLVPVIGVAPVGMTKVADRYTYLPSIGLGIAIVWSVAALVRGRWQLERLGRGIAVVAVVGLGLLTVRDTPRWRSSLELFGSAIEVAPHKVAYCNLAYYHLRQEEFDRAVELSTSAIELDPSYGAAYSSRAMAYACGDDYVNAKRDYDEGIRLGDQPLRPMPNFNPASVTGTNPEAHWEQFSAAIALAPRTAAGFLLRAESRMKFQATSLAGADYTKAIELDPTLAAAWLGRATAFNLTGDVTAAIQDASQAITLNPDYAEAYLTRAVAQTRAGNYELALQDNTRSIELSPTNSLAYQNRAVTHYLMKNFELAWLDIAQSRTLGGVPHESFIKALSEASGRTR